MKGYVRVELLRSLRDPFYLFLAVVVPIFFYLLFAGLFGAGNNSYGKLDNSLELMIAQATYCGIWACLVATSPRIANERSSGWFRQLRLLPISPWTVLAGRALVAILLALPTMLLICATAVLTHGVHLAAGQWLSVIGSIWIGVWPFALMGIALGYVTNETTAFGVTYGLYMVLSAAGGLWVPPAVLPTTMQNIGKALPTYQAADLGWRLAGGESPELTSILVLTGWALVFLVIATLFARRAAQVR